MNKEDFIARLLLLLIAVLFVAMCFAVHQRDILKEEAVKRGQEAVKRGFAEWVVSTTGEAEWKWKEAK